MKVNRYRFTRTEEVNGLGEARLEVDTDRGLAIITPEDCKLLAHDFDLVHVGDEIAEKEFEVQDEDGGGKMLTGYTDNEDVIRLAVHFLFEINTPDYQVTDWQAA